MPISRRKFVQRLSAVTAAGAASSMFGVRDLLAAPAYLGAMPRSVSFDSADASFADVSDVRQLALAAIDAAKAAGATFADVKVTRTILQQSLISRSEYFAGVIDEEHLAIGVRALVNGYWGFAASPFWERDEAIQLAQDAVAQARTNALGSPRTVQLGQGTAVTGTWTMPVRIDPFTVPIEEKIEYLTARLEDLSHYRRYVSPHTSFFRCWRQERTVANTEGSLFTQIVYETGGDVQAQVLGEAGDNSYDFKVADTSSFGGGWEIFADQGFWEHVPVKVAEAEELLKLPRKPVDVGRYDVIFDAESSAKLLDTTLGAATELDRAMGFEANAVGTSYLGPNPIELLGTFQPAASLISVTANRSAPGSINAVKWDDEGIAPQDFTLIKGGALADYQTTRESSAWLTPWYQKRGTSTASHGCAGSETALAITTQHRPNLVLEPDARDTSYTDLIRGIKKGFAFSDTKLVVDFQARNGFVYGLAREIVNGKLGAVVNGASISFSSAELWKNVSALGGKHSAARIGAESSKGQPKQTTRHSVTAVPMHVTNVGVFDSMRRA